MERPRIRRTAEEQEAARLDLFRYVVLIAFFLLMLSLLSLVLPGCRTVKTPHHEQEPRAPRQPVYTWHYAD